MPYPIYLDYAHQHSTIGTESRSNQYTAGFSRLVTSVLESHASVTYWKDSLNEVHYAGPTLGVTYRWEAGHPLPARQAWMEAPPRPILAATLDADIFIYGTDVSASSSTRIVFDRTLNRFVTRVIPAGTADAHVTQLHPSVSFDLLWFESVVTPYVTAGHYFYSRDPARLEDITGLPRFSGAADRIYGLIGGFLNNSGETGLRLRLPGAVEAIGRIGAAQSATDHHWSTTQGAALNRTFFGHITTKVDWSRAIQAGISIDLITGGLSWEF